MTIVAVISLFDNRRKKKYLTIFSEKPRGKNSTSGNQHES